MRYRFLQTYPLEDILSIESEYIKSNVGPIERYKGKELDEFYKDSNNGNVSTTVKHLLLW